jgi:hypothetical protein
MSGLFARIRARPARRSMVAPLNSSLVLTAGRRVPGDAGRVRASATAGRWPRRRTISVCEWTGAPAEDGSSTAVLTELLDDLVRRLDGSERSELHDTILDAVSADLDGENSYALAKSLNLIRERLRSPAPELKLDSGEPVVVDQLRMVDDRSLWVTGWCIGGDDTLGRLYLVSPEGYRSGPLEGSYRYPRQDIEELWPETGTNHGFTQYLELSASSHLSEGWLGELHHPSGSQFQLELPRSSASPRRRAGASSSKLPPTGRRSRP